MTEYRFYLEDHPYIALCDLLKLTGIAHSGGQAKAMIADGLVLRNGHTETRKTAKIHAQDHIQLGDVFIQVHDGWAP